MFQNSCNNVIMRYVINTCRCSLDVVISRGASRRNVVGNVPVNKVKAIPESVEMLLFAPTQRLQLSNH